MYKVNPYSKVTEDEAVRFIKENPFAVIVTSVTNGFPEATQVPFLIEKRGDSFWLRGHIMRGTSHYDAFQNSSKALVVFSGVDAYVSASWYENPNAASTWNYMTVQVKGELQFLEDEQSLIQLLKDTSLHFEEGDFNSPTFYDNLDPSYTERLLSAIVAFEIEVTEISPTFKLSQDQNPKTYANIITRLKQKDAKSVLLAAQMEAR